MPKIAAPSRRLRWGLAPWSLNFSRVRARQSVSSIVGRSYELLEHSQIFSGAVALSDPRLRALHLRAVGGDDHTGRSAPRAAAVFGSQYRGEVFG